MPISLLQLAILPEKWLFIRAGPSPRRHQGLLAYRRHGRLPVVIRAPFRSARRSRPATVRRMRLEPVLTMLLNFAHNVRSIGHVVLSSAYAVQIIRAESKDCNRKFEKTAILIVPATYKFVPPALRSCNDTLVYTTTYIVSSVLSRVVYFVVLVGVTANIGRINLRVVSHLRCFTTVAPCGHSEHRCLYLCELRLELMFGSGHVERSCRGHYRMSAFRLIARAVKLHS